MGANPYCYFTRYEPNVGAALEKLRQREFRAGRYDPALRAANTYTFEQSFPPDRSFPSPGAQHDSIEEALEAGMESGDGTGSILDIQRISSDPHFFHANPLSPADLTAIFGSVSPTRRDIEMALDDERGDEFWESIGRGEARYVIVYANHAPAQIFFAGISLD